MESVEAEGHTIDEAIERALQRLGVSREKVDIEIVSNASRGLFGLGGRPAKVRATLRRPLEFTAGAPAARTAGASPSPPKRPTAPPVPAARATADLSAGTPPQPRREHRQRPPDTTRRPTGSPHAPSQTTAAPAPLNEASIDRARALLAEIVRLTGSEASVEVAREADDVRLLITGDASGLLIGRRGQTLDALEYVLHRIMAHDDEVGVRLLVDAENYRVRRREALEQLARRTAERARRSGKPLTLSPMSPRDRRIVHLTLQNDPTLTTRSAGNGFYRKVVIVPAGARRGRRSGPPQTP